MTSDIFKPLITLFNNMDKTWNKIAESYLFQCNGCEDNCCKSLFFHHTYIEKAYLLYGFNALDQNTKETIQERAQKYCKKTFSQAREIRSHKIYCPVNEKGLCLLYKFRPMICRLHGLPHEIDRPGSFPVRGPGCDAGMFNTKPYIKFDRTPFYRAMVQIESDYRGNINKTDKIKQSIAQMLISQKNISKGPHGQ
jgi:Fe-S-cluster containining protein